MKIMNCRELGGACEQEFQAESFDEIAELSKQHGMDMFQQKDAAHLEAMGAMQELMQDPADMNKWFAGKRQEFDALPDS